jgi:hypothetical protein
MTAPREPFRCLRCHAVRHARVDPGYCACGCGSWALPTRQAAGRGEQLGLPWSTTP